MIEKLGAASCAAESASANIGHIQARSPTMPVHADALT